MLQSADFLYRVEKGDPTAPPDAVAPVDHYEMATRLSYFFWGTMPDKALFDAAGAKQLGTSAEVETQVRRMLADAKAKLAVANFHREWLNMDGVAGADKDKTLFPEFTDAVRVGLQQEVSTFVDQVFWNDGKFETLFHRTLFVPRQAARRFLRRDTARRRRVRQSRYQFLVGLATSSAGKIVWPAL